MHASYRSIVSKADSIPFAVLGAFVLRKVGRPLVKGFAACGLSSTSGSSASRSKSTAGAAADPREQIISQFSIYTRRESSLQVPRSLMGSNPASAARQIAPAELRAAAGEGSVCAQTTTAVARSVRYNCDDGLTLPAEAQNPRSSRLVAELATKLRAGLHFSLSARNEANGRRGGDAYDPRVELPAADSWAVRRRGWPATRSVSTFASR